MAVTDFQNQASAQPPQEGPATSSGLRERLVPPMPGNPLWGWLGPLLITVLGGALRFLDLGHPKAVVFDETYYAKDALALVEFGVEKVTIDGADQQLLAGNANIWKQCAADQLDQCASYVVHPPLGKWMIGLGEWLFGATPFGWRFSAALFGTLSILILARAARRMTRSTLLGCLAGLLLAVEGLHFVLSRFALLDVFLTFWVIAGFACLVADRDWSRSRLVDWYDRSPATDEGPSLGWRPWRLAAGACLGAACAVKWSGVFFLIGFLVLSLMWDAGARRALGLPRPYRGTLRRDLPGALLAMPVLSALVYIVSWTGWFASAQGYGRNWDQAVAGGPLFFVVDSARSWWNYQIMALSFHTGLDQQHSYQSWPWEWPLLLRPVAFYWGENPKGCGAEHCAEAVLGTGTPVIWFAGAAALLGMIAWYVATRDWRAGAVLLGYGVGWLPWFYYAISSHRTMFQFYALPLVPFMILALVLAAGLILGPADAAPNRRIAGATTVGAFALLALINFWWLHPVLTADIITYDEWHSRMLFRRWI